MRRSIHGMCGGMECACGLGRELETSGQRQPLQRAPSFRLYQLVCRVLEIQDIHTRQAGGGKNLPGSSEVCRRSAALAQHEARYRRVFPKAVLAKECGGESNDQRVRPADNQQRECGRVSTDEFDHPCT